MYKPSQVGAYPIIKIGSSNSWNPLIQQVQGQPEDQIRPVFQRATVRGDYDSVNIDENVNFTIAAASGFTLGLGVDGTHPDGLPVHVVYSFAASIHGQVTGQNNRAGVNLRAFIGKSALSALPTARPTHDFSPNNVFQLPVDSFFVTGDRHAVSTADREFSHISGRGQLVMEPPDQVVSRDFPLFLCINVMSPEGETNVSVTNISMSMALHKYVAPLDVFDPER